MLHIVGQTPCRVFVADDHKIPRMGIVTLLADRGSEICGEADGGESAQAMILRLWPDVATIDLRRGIFQRAAKGSIYSFEAITFEEMPE